MSDLNEASLDWDAVDCVLADLDHLTQVVPVPGREADSGSVAVTSVEQGRNALVQGGLYALQVTSQFADHTWCDILSRDPTGAPLLCTRLPKRPVGAVGLG